MAQSDQRNRLVTYVAALARDRLDDLVAFRLDDELFAAAYDYLDPNLSALSAASRCARLSSRAASHDCATVCFPFHCRLRRTERLIHKGGILPTPGRVPPFFDSRFRRNP